MRLFRLQSIIKAASTISTSSILIYSLNSSSNAFVLHHHGTCVRFVKKHCLKYHVLQIKEVVSSNNFIRHGVDLYSTSGRSNGLNQNHRQPKKNHAPLLPIKEDYEDSLTDCKPFLSSSELPPSSPAEETTNKYGKRGEKNRDFGKNENFAIIEHFQVPEEGFAFNNIFQSLLADKLESKQETIKSKTSNNEQEIQDVGSESRKPNEKDFVKSRSDLLKLSNNNVTLPIALLSLRPNEYPSMSRARKACRNGSILIHRGPLPLDADTNEEYFAPERCKRGRVDDRVYPNDIIAKQVRVSGAFYPGLKYAKPPFEVPVVFEDDHFAIVNKPAGVVTYQHRKSGQPSRISLSAALPFALHPPSDGTTSILRKPAPVHRLDKPTSGLLVTAKTKPAMVDLSRQFAERKVKKTYTAIVNGIPDELVKHRVSAKEARAMGVDVSVIGPEGDNHWQLIDFALDGKHAITLWRALQYAKSLKANQNYITMVELKPKTGRFHQLRRHMAWVCECPLIGDKTYDTASESAIHFREKKGLYLCSNRVVLEHPFYNTEQGRKVWDKMLENHNNCDPKSEYIENGVLRLSNDRSTVEVHVSIELPSKFVNLMKWEEDRANRFANNA